MVTACFLLYLHLLLKPLNLLGTNYIWRNINNGKNGTHNLEGEQQGYSVFLVKSPQSVPYNTKNEIICF